MWLAYAKAAKTFQVQVRENVKIPVTHPMTVESGSDITIGKGSKKNYSLMTAFGWYDIEDDCIADMVIKSHN